MSVTACLVTRGDVDMTPIIESLSHLDEVLVWDNSKRDNLAVYGRYALIAEAQNPLIFVQDDDVILAREAIDEIVWECDSGGSAYGRLVCNMPPEFRHDFYQDHALVGFGACFHRDLPTKAFSRMWSSLERNTNERGIQLPDNTAHVLAIDPSYWPDTFLRTCDVVFTMLTPRTLVDVSVEHRPFAHDDNRMWKQKDHFGERMQMLKLARSVLEH